MSVYSVAPKISGPVLMLWSEQVYTKTLASVANRSQGEVKQSTTPPQH